MAILKALKDSKDFSASVDYCEGLTNKKDEPDKCVLKEGYNCEIDRIREEAQETRELFNKHGGRQAKHYVLSFAEEELGQTPEDYQKCLEMGYLFAERAFPNQEVGIFVHGNTDNVHCHILVHAVNIEDGKKIQLKKDALIDLKQTADEVCQDYGIGLKTQKSAEYEHVNVVSAHDKGNSWTEHIKTEVDSALDWAINYADFEKRLRESGIACEQKRYTNRNTGDTQDYILFTYFDEEKGKERKIKSTTLSSRFKNDRLEATFARNRRVQALTRQTAGQEPHRTPKSAPAVPIRIETTDETQEILDDEKQAIFEDTREKIREADSQEEVERIKKEESLKQELVDREKELARKKEADYKRAMARFQRGRER